MMCLDDPAGDCKSKTGPVRFVSDKGLEDSLLVFGSDAATVVPDPDMQRICLETDRECNDRLLGIRSLFVQCIAGITKKIQNCLTELYGRSSGIRETNSISVSTIEAAKDKAILRK